MKQLLLLFIFLFFIASTNICFAQAPDCVWIKTAGGTKDDIPFSTAIDKEGNVYVAGHFKSSAITFGSENLTNATPNALFIVKYDPYGQVIWARSASEAGDFGQIYLTVDVNNNLYVAGSFLSTTITFGSTVLTNNKTNSEDSFILKYDKNGMVVWATSIGGPEYDDMSGIATDANGNIYVTGFYYSPSLSFGSYTLTKTVGDINNNFQGDYYNVFTAKYNSSGTVLWAKSSHGNSFDRSTSISADPLGNVYITGFFQSKTFHFEEVYLTNNAQEDIFIVKYDTDGNILWGKAHGGDQDDATAGIVLDLSGNVYINGYYNSATLNFGSETLTNKAAGTDDLFLVKYDTNGNILWAQTAGGEKDDECLNLLTTLDGQIITIGGFASSAIVFDTKTINNVDSVTTFIVSYTSDGNVNWTQKISAAYDKNIAISGCADSQNNLYISGVYTGPSLVCGSVNVGPSVGDHNYDVYLAKLGTNLPTATTKSSENSLSLYPNPSKGKLTINYLPSGDHQLTIYSVYGQKVFMATVREKVEIDLTDYPSGNYFCQTQDEAGKLYTQKFVLE